MDGKVYNEREVTRLLVTDDASSLFCWVVEKVVE